MWVLAAFLVGFFAAAVVAPRLAPATPVAASPSPAPTPSPTPEEDDPQVFAQPLVAGCGLREEAYVVSHGGGIARFDGRHWRLIDDTLRDLRAVACMPELVLAVGDGGRLVRIDPVRREIRSDVIADADLYVVALLDGGTAYVAGDRQVVMRFANGRWERLGRGEEGTAWRAIFARQPNEVWFAGDHGALFFLDGQTFRDRSIAGGPDLVAIGPSPTGPSVVGADGRVFTLEPTREVRPAGTVGGLRAYFSPDGSTLYLLLSDRVLVQRRSAERVPVDTGLTCPPRAMFASAENVFVLGRDDGRVGIARSRLGAAAWTKLGNC